MPRVWLAQSNCPLIGCALESLFRFPAHSRCVPATLTPFVVVVVQIPQMRTTDGIRVAVLNPLGVGQTALDRRVVILIVVLELRTK